MPIHRAGVMYEIGGIMASLPLLLDARCESERGLFAQLVGEKLTNDDLALNIQT